MSYQPPPYDAPPPFDTPPQGGPLPSGYPQQKDRHGCLTAYLIFAIILTAFIAAFSVAIPSLISAIEGSLQGSDLVEFQEAVGGAPSISSLVIGSAVLLVGLVGYVGIWMWKKWGFWVVVAAAVLEVIVGAVLFPAGQIPSSAVQSLVIVGLLYGILHIGERNQGWPQLD